MCDLATEVIGQEAFHKTASMFWNPRGPFRLLHQITPLRLEFIHRTICEAGLAEPETLQQNKVPIELPLPASLKGLHILDVGCGGGLVCEPLARKGATVTGIDTTEQAIRAAKTHKEGQKESLDITYHHTPLAKYAAKRTKKFDIILALEVIEHQTKPLAFMQQATKLLKRGGLFILSTPNRTLKSYFALIQIAEKLELIAPNTHEWSAFLTPTELENLGQFCGLKVLNKKGVSFNFFRQKWLISGGLSVNYFMSFLNKK